MKLILALCAFFVPAVALSACGSGVPGDSVADMAGNPITRQTFNHWLYVAAKGNAAQSPGAPVIIANDPPDFTNCISQVRKQIPTLAKTPDKQIRSDCNELFTSLGSQVMDFLIKADWYQAEAAKQHVTVTNAQVQQAYQAAAKQQFSNPGELQAFLSQSGQTTQDLIFRVRINQILKQLLAKEQKAGTSQTAAQTKLDAQAKKDWQHKTKCQSDYATTADCTNYTAPKTKSTAGSSATTTTSAP